MNGVYSLSEAAKYLGINRATLRRWITESGYDIRVPRGSKFLLSTSDLHRVLAGHSMQSATEEVQ